MAHRYYRPPHGSGANSAVSMVTALVRDSKTYPAQNESTVVTQVVDSMRQCHTLLPRLATYTSNTGVSQRLLSLVGTIPIHFRGAQYNIPVTIWIMSYHPNGPPKVYVTPTESMVVRSRHRHVDAAGMVYLPYLSGWEAGRSTIEELIGMMVSVFSQDPPVYERSAASASAQPTMSSSDIERASLIQAVKERVKTELDAVQATGEREMVALLEEKQKLEEMIRQGDNGKGQMIAGIERDIEQLTLEKEKLEAWMKANAVEKGDLTIDRIMVPQDMSSVQIVECVAADHALQDAMEALDDAMEAEKIDQETFLKEIRKLAREQFMARALLRKVKLIQAQKARQQSVSMYPNPVPQVTPQTQAQPYMSQPRSAVPLFSAQ